MSSDGVPKSKILSSTALLPARLPKALHKYPCRHLLSNWNFQLTEPYHQFYSIVKLHLRQFVRMASSAKPPIVPPAELESFQQYLKSSNRILALVGAGLSASSGLPTFRGAGGLWRTHEAMELATPEAFKEDPALVWQFYSYRRHMALKAKPNRAHYALAELSRRKEGFMTLSQNVDGTVTVSQLNQHRLASLG